MVYIVKPLEIAQMFIREEANPSCPDYGCPEVACNGYDPCPWLCFGYACGIVT